MTLIVPGAHRGLFSEAAEMLHPPYGKDPLGWVAEKLGDHLWSVQRTIFEALPVHRRVAVHSSYLAGKSWTAARVVGWWIDQHYPGEAFAVTTAPTGSQVRTILWREINRAHAKGHLRGRTLQTEWQIRNEQVALGRKPADYDPTALQGIHARYVLGVIDEAAGVPERIWEAIDSLTGNDDSRVLAIGNPDDPFGQFAKACAPGSGWHVIHIDGLLTPNFTGEAIPDHLRRVLLSEQWVEEKRREWGEDSPMWMSKVRGLFPDQDPARVTIPLAWIRRCQRDEGAWGLIGPQLPGVVELGVDVGAGGDETVIRERRGHVLGRVWKDHSRDSNVVTDAVLAAIDEARPATVKVDDVGIGWGVLGNLKRYRDLGRIECRVIGVGAGDKSSQPDRFPTLRDELWWMARELVHEGLVDMRQVDDTAVAQLAAPLYAPVTGGNRIKVESKDETRKRIGRSPDDADAILLALYRPPSQDVTVSAVQHEPSIPGRTRRSGGGTTGWQDPRGN